MIKKERKIIKPNQTPVIANLPSSIIKMKIPNTINDIAEMENKITLFLPFSFDLFIAIMANVKANLIWEGPKIVNPFFTKFRKKRVYFICKIFFTRAILYLE